MPETLENQEQRTFLDAADVDIIKAKNAINDDGDPENMSIETLALLVQADRIKLLERKMREKVDIVKERQSDVRFLHSLLSKINNALDEDGELHIKDDQELKDMLKRAREMKVDIPADKTSWDKDEKDRLVDNLRMSCEDLSNENQMELQDSQMLMNQRFETYEMTKSILKPLHEDKVNKARKIAGG